MSLSKSKRIVFLAVCLAPLIKIVLALHFPVMHANILSSNSLQYFFLCYLFICLHYSGNPHCAISSHSYVQSSNLAFTLVTTFFFLSFLSWRSICIFSRFQLLHSVRTMVFGMLMSVMLSKLLIVPSSQELSLKIGLTLIIPYLLYLQFQSPLAKPLSGLQYYNQLPLYPLWDGVSIFVRSGRFSIIDIQIIIQFSRKKHLTFHSTLPSFISPYMPPIIQSFLHDAHSNIKNIIQLMLDNFLEQEYRSYDKVYTHPTSANCIFIGDFQSATDSSFHQKCNIRTIVTAAANMDHLAFDGSISHVVFPLLDSKNQNIATFFERFYELIEKQILLGSILVHCSAGISRSSTLVISYLMRKLKFTFREAIVFARKTRPKVLPNLGFERQLKKYEQALRKNSSRSQRVPRRIQVRTSQSGKSERSIKIDLFPFEDAFPSLKIQKSKDSDKMKRCIDKLNEKGIQIPKQPTGRREQSRNRIILADKLKKLNPSQHQRVFRTQAVQQQANLLQFLRVQNKRVFKSKTIISEAPPFEDRRCIDALKKHFSDYRKSSLLNNINPFQRL